ncbi:hypothetical protein ACJX0J_017735, partial [Zea mays]
IGLCRPFIAVSSFSFRTGPYTQPPIKTCQIRARLPQIVNKPFLSNDLRNSFSSTKKLSSFSCKSSLGGGQVVYKYKYSDHVLLFLKYTITKYIIKSMHCYMLYKVNITTAFLMTPALNAPV